MSTNVKVQKIGRDTVEQQTGTVLAIVRECQERATDEGIVIDLVCDGETLQRFLPMH